MLKAALFFLSLLVVSSATDLPTLSPTSGPTSVRSSQYSIQAYLGTGSASTSGTGGLASVATVNQPRSVWMDSTDVLYVSECQGNCVRIVDTSNIVRDFAGTCGSSGSSGDGGPASSAQMQYPLGLYISSTSVVYVTDFTAFRVRSVTPSGIITTFLGTGTGPNSGDGGAASSASMDGPHSIWGNSVGVIYVGSYSGYLIRAVSALGIITLFAGSGTKSFSGDGGPATSCSISRPSKMFGATTGTVYFTDQENYRVRMIGTSGIISTIMGSGGTAYSGESVAATASSVSVGTDLKLDPNNGDLFVSDYTLARVFVMTGSSQLVTTFAGTGTSGSSGNGGAATSAQVNGPDGLWLDQNSFKVYLAEQQGYTVRLIYSTAPTASPSRLPSLAPSVIPSVSPTMSPTCLPSLAPSVIPSASPTVSPTVSPTCLPSLAPSVIPSASPTVSPSLSYLSIRSSPSYKVTNALAFAGITSNGSVIAWGASGSGGDCSAVSSRLSNVVEIVSSKHAFAALKSDGAVVAWGNNGEIDGWSAATTGVTVTSLVGSERAFAGVTEGGAVIAFGADCCGGNVDQYGWAVQYLSSDVKSVTASAGAFCALKTDGSVYCWGSDFAGGGMSSVSRSDLTDIVLLTSTRSAFAGMTSDGNVIMWGNHEFGGSVSDAVSSAVAGNTLHILSNQKSFAAYTTSGVISTWGTSEVTVNVGSDVKYVAHSSGAFAAILGNGSVVSWGDAKVGGGVAVPANVTHLVGNVGAFAALSVDGESVTVWGAESHGGSLNGSLMSVKSLIGSSRAFAALLSNGSVVAWGSVGAGGVISSEVENYLSSGVRLLCANDVAFTAIKTDGRAVTWGHTLSVVASVINGGFEELNEC